jgi:hypothetical protein
MMVAAETFMIVFRILHIVGGVLWVGSTFLFSVFIGPAAAAVGPAAGPLLHQLVVKQKVTKAITGIAVVTVVAGGFVYWRDLQLAGSLGDFVSTDFGLVLTVGAALGITALFWGYFQVGEKVDDMVAFAGSALTADGPPPPDVAIEMDRRGAQLRTNSIIDLLLQLGAVIAMSTARYW